jgi:hypothetical protein
MNVYILYLFPALYGLLFKDKRETAFAALSMFDSVGFVIGFAGNSYLCTDVKVYACLGMLGLTIPSYAVLEAMYNKDKMKNLTNKDDTIQ